MPWPLCLWQCIKTNSGTKIFETGIETPYETKSFKSKSCISLENNISIARTLRVINFTFAFNLEICETHASLNITIDLWKCTAYFGRTIIPPLRERRNVNFVPRKLRLLEETRRVSKSTWSSIPSHGRSSCRSRRRRTRWRWWRTRDLLMRKWTGSPWSRWN